MSVEDIELEFWADIFYQKLRSGQKPKDILESSRASLDFDSERTSQDEIDRINSEDNEDNEAMGLPHDFETVFDEKVSGF